LILFGANELDNSGCGAMSGYCDVELKYSTIGKACYMPSGYHRIMVGKEQSMDILFKKSECFV